MDYLYAKKILVDEAIIVTDLIADSKIQALRESVRLLYDKKYGHDCIGDLLARIIGHEKRGSYLIAEGVALPHLYISDGEFEDRAGWFTIKNGIEYGNLMEKVFMFLLCIGSEEFVKSVTAVGLELCRCTGFAESAIYRARRIRESHFSRGCILSGLLTVFEVNKQREIILQGKDIIKVNLILENLLGLHARASARFVTCASRFEADISLLQLRGKREVEVNGKSIMGVMMLTAPFGTEICIKAKGQDAEQAIYALRELIQRKFYEDE